MRSDWFHKTLVSYLPQMRRFAYSLCGNRTEADDILHDAVEKALSRRVQLLKRSRIKGWLFQIVYREFIDERRRQARQATPDGNVLTLVHPVAASQESTSECRSVLEAMEDLPEDQRAALSLIAIEGFSYDEAARMLKLNEGTLRSRLARARKTLRDQTGSTTSAERRAHLRRVR